MRHKLYSTALLALTVVLPIVAAHGQPMLPPQDLERIVGPVALYPDSLLAQTLAAATYYDQIPDAARWADQHHYLAGDNLAAAIRNDNLPFDPAVQSLLPFPSVLDRMSSDMNWTRQLGEAFLAQPTDVMDAVQRARRHAYDYGYLRSGNQIVVRNGPYIEIAPVNPGYIVVPYYDPAIVYYPPHYGFYVSSGISFGFGVNIGTAFRPWGWGYSRFGWGEHAVYINNAPWGRRWDNREDYFHRGWGNGFERREGFVPGQRFDERHDVVERSERERSAERFGHPRVEDHRFDQRRAPERRPEERRPHDHE